MADKADKLIELLREALDELEEPSASDRLADAIERLAKAIEARSYRYSNHYVYPTDPVPPYTITYCNGDSTNSISFENTTI